MTVHPSSSNRRAAPSAEKTIAFAALRHRDYRRYFFVHFFSTLGDNIEHVISYWLLFQKFRSPVLGGFAVISHWTPFLFFAVYFGALADRHNCRRIIQASQLLYAGVSLTWGFLFLTDTIEVWHACVLLVLHGMAGVLGGPGGQQPAAQLRRSLKLHQRLRHRQKSEIEKTGAEEQRHGKQIARRCGKSDDEQAPENRADGRVARIGFQQSSAL